MLEFVKALTGPASYSLAKSIVYGTVLFTFSIGIYNRIWLLTESKIIIIGYPDVREQVMYDVQKGLSWVNRIFLIKLKREAKARHGSVLFYWWFNILNCICVIGSTIAWVGILVMRNKAWMWLGAELVFCFMMISLAAMFLPDIIYFFKSKESKQEKKK